MNAQDTKKLREACERVEQFSRTIGKDCEIIFMDQGVQVAPLSWSGDVVGKNLFEALIEAHESRD
jgi:hypothetical protein